MRSVDADHMLRDPRLIDVIDEHPVPVLAGDRPLDVEREGHAAPFLGDLDGDGKLALLVGQYFEGRLRIYRNVGTRDKPKFDAYTWFEADLTLGDAQLPRVGIRKKGFLGSVVGTGFAKPSLKVDTDRFVDDQAIGETDGLTLNNESSDPTRMASCLQDNVSRSALASCRSAVSNPSVNQL